MCVNYLCIIFTGWERVQLGLLFDKHREVGAEHYESYLHRNVFPMLGHEVANASDISKQTGIERVRSENGAVFVFLGSPSGWARRPLRRCCSSFGSGLRLLSTKTRQRQVVVHLYQATLFTIAAARADIPTLAIVSRPRRVHLDALCMWTRFTQESLHFCNLLRGLLEHRPQRLELIARCPFRSLSTHAP